MVYEDMTASTPQSKIPLREIVERIFSTRKITRGDQMRFMKIVLEQEPITSEDRQHIDRLFEELKRGLLQIVD